MHFGHDRRFGNIRSPDNKEDSLIIALDGTRVKSPRKQIAAMGEIT